MDKNIFHTQGLKKYDIAVPRYTSYPAVPFWNINGFDTHKWIDGIKSQAEIQQSAGIALYIHLPYCESLCTYCGCNKYITTNHAVEKPYVDAVLLEWELYKKILPRLVYIRSIHLGGGTPTFFTAEQLHRLISGLKSGMTCTDDFEGSVEVHPNYTSDDQLKILRQHGFNRISIGVQDVDPKVQFIINRIQPQAETIRVVETARKLGFEQVNLDLVYGLPLQTLDSIQRTLHHVADIMPNRIAYYSYAHVPWKSKGQRRYTESDLPSSDLKWQMNAYIHTTLEELGYDTIGMDHYALANDALFKALKEGKLHRNFMGYTVQDAPILIGLGASSISDAAVGYAQNVKDHKEYMIAIESGSLAIDKGHIQTDVDHVWKTHIMNIMCNFRTYKSNLTSVLDWNRALESLEEMVADGLVHTSPEAIIVTEVGKPFIRNIASRLDLYFMQTLHKEEPVFSKAI